MMKRILALVLAMAMTLGAGNALALTIDSNTPQPISGTYDERIVVKQGVTQVRFQNVTVNAPTGQYALEVEGDDVTLIFEGENNTLNGGRGEGALSNIGKDGIFADGNVTIVGTVTVNGGEGRINEDKRGGKGGDGVNASGNVTITGSVTAQGGKGGGDDGNGGDGISSYGAVTISGSAAVQATGGEGNEGGSGIHAENGVTISGSVTAQGGAGARANGSEGTFSQHQIDTMDQYPGDPRLFVYVKPVEPVEPDAPGGAAAADDMPQTGDPSMLGAWAALLAASAAGLRMKKKKYVK